MKKDINAPTRAVDAAAEYLCRHKAWDKPAPKVIGHELPCCPPLEEPLWEHNKGQFGFTPPDRLVRFAWVA